jgi:cytochrome P450
VATAWWLARPVTFMNVCRKRCGDTFSVSFIGFERPLVMISDPDAVRELYSERSHGLPPGRSLALLPVVGPDSLLLVEGEGHLARRRLMSPPFHGERMRSYESIMREVADAEVDTWAPGSTLVLHPRMQAVTLEVILQAVFGVRDIERGDQLRQGLKQMLDDNASPALQLQVLLSRRFQRGDPLAELQELKHAVDRVLFAEIAERRRDPDLDQREDILSMLIGARMEDGSAMSDQELRDQLMTLLLAGHETTATALAWTFDLLLHHPAQLAHLTAEVRAGTDEEYLRAVVSEALRLRPVIPLAGRRLKLDMTVGKYTLPAGTDVTPAIWLTHTRSDIYPDPFAFRPERFLENAPSTYGWIPFGGGIRRCLGAAFAELEMRAVIKSVLGRCTLEPLRGRPEAVARRNVTLTPRHGTRVRVLARSAAHDIAVESVAA